MKNTAPDEQSDESLIEETKRGKIKAFGDLVQRYRHRITGFVRKYLRRKEDAEDASQITFIKAWKGLGNFRKGKLFKPWLFAIAKNTAIDMIVTEKTISFSEIESAGSTHAFEETIYDKSNPATSRTEKDESRTSFKRLISGLSAREKFILIMHYKRMMNFNEIASLIGVPMNTVKSWHHRTIVGLRQRLYTYNHENSVDNRHFERNRSG